MNYPHHSPQYPIPFVYMVTCPTMGEKFCTKERRTGFGPLGVITLLQPKNIYHS